MTTAFLTTPPQTTKVGTRVVTVARDGARCAVTGGAAYPIFVTAIYRAKARTFDGVITWRRVGQLDDGTASGRGITPPMVERAKAQAVVQGVEYVPGIRHGKVCP